MALVLVLGALTILTVMLTEVQDESSADFASALAARDELVAEYAARSAVNLSRLLIATEPTIRKSVGPLFLMMSGGKAPPQIPVWEFADQVLGAFNDADGDEELLVARRASTSQPRQEPRACRAPASRSRSSTRTRRST